MSAKPGFSERDLKLLVGFAFFAEVVLGWFFLVDPAFGKLGKLERELAGAREALGALQAVAPSAAPGPRASAGPTPPPPLAAGTSEGAALAIQRHVAEAAAKVGVTPVAVSVVEDAASASPAPLGVRRADVVVTGTYEAVERFVGELAWPDVREGIEKLAVAGEPGGELVRAELRLVVATK